MPYIAHTACCVVYYLQLLLAENDKDRARDLSELLYETSLLTSGFSLDQPRDYAAKVYTLMKIALGYDVMGDFEEQEQEQAGSNGSSSPAAAAAATADGSTSTSGSSSSTQPSSSEAVAAEPVEAEVVTGDDVDPWARR